MRMSRLPAITDISPRPGPRWEELRPEMIGLIESHSHVLWTDFNVHDPGITVGEHLLFGLTEAAYVAGLPMADLLTSSPDRDAPPSPNAPANVVLPCRPLTLLDYRKLLIDQEDVRNAWIETVESPAPKVLIDCARHELALDPNPDTREVPLRGFYRVLVELAGEPTRDEERSALNRLREVLAAHRNLCEVFLEVVAVPVDEAGICAELVVAEDADLEEVAARAYLVLERFIEPPIPFHTLDEMLERGLSAEEIFEGPLLRHGFIDDADLAAAERKSELRGSDLIQVLLDVPGILALRKLLMTRYRAGVPVSAGEPWRLLLDSARATRFASARSRLLFFKRDLPFLVREEEVRRRIAEFRTAELREKQAPKLSALPLPSGRLRRIVEFQTLLNSFPLNYGVGQAGLPPDATPERAAQGRQLKAYFLLAEFLLSGHRAQVARLPEIFSLLRNAPVLSASSPAAVRELKSLTDGRDEAEFAELLQPIVESESDRVRRRTAICDHLLARFAEPFDPYVIISTGRSRQPYAHHLLADKARLLAALPILAHDRAAALDVCLDPSRTDNLSGLERKLHTLLGSAPGLGAALELFEESDADGVIKWRFRIRAPSGEILLSSSRHYLIRAAVDVETAAVARNASLPERYQRKTNREGRFYFNLMDETGEIVARGIEFFLAEPAREAAIAACLAFFQSLPPEIEFYLLEHILLRPRAGSMRLLPVCDPESGPAGACPCDDPYSFRATLVLPSWPARFRNLYFREHFERVVREQAPAHIFMKICWVTREQMAQFRTAWTAWRRDLAAECAGEPHTLAQTQDALIDVWLQLRSQFPVATLHDCVDGNDDNPVVLDRSVLGNLEEENPI
jgi:hypothetical protein